MCRNFVLIDLDNTLAAAWRREDLINESWDKFHEDCINDEVIADIAKMVRSLCSHFLVIAITGRNEKYRQVTLKWLLSHDIPVDDLWMRADNDYRPTSEVKVELAANYFDGVSEIKNHVAMMIDDTESVITAFSGLGITTLHCLPRRV